MMRPVTAEGRLQAFLKATGAFSGASRRWADRAQTGLSDGDLAQALAFELGIMGGSGGPDVLSIAYQGAGLKIWASWESINLVRDRPVYEGRGTIAMARQVFGVRDPEDRQLTLL